MRATFLLLALAASFASGSSSSAGTTEVAIGSTTRALRSTSADAVTANTLDGGLLTLARDLHLDVVPGLAVWADAGFGWGGATGSLFQTMATSIDSYALTVGGRARYSLHRLVAVSARVDLGMARASLSLSDSSGHSASDHGWGETAAGAVGLELIAIAHQEFRLGLRFELGYVSTTAVSLTAKPASPSDGTLQLQMTSASLGHLDLAGPSFGVSVVSQF